MGADSDISWTTSTWNPATGCTKVSAGCANCYMYRDMARYGRDATTITRTAPSTFNGPVRRKRDGSFALPGPYLFTASWTDIGHEEIDPFRSEVWAIVRERDRIERGEGLPRSYFQVLTKRADRFPLILPPDWGDGYPNVWLGVTVEHQETAWRADRLREVPAVVRFVSYEPAVGPVEWGPVLPGIHWLISGGESGPRARPSHPAWFRAARDAAVAAGVAFHHKQNGEWCAEPGGVAEGDYVFPDGTEVARVGRVAAGRRLDGRTWDEFPG